MPPHVIKMLERMGLKKGATEAEARAFADQNGITLLDSGGIRLADEGGDTPPAGNAGNRGGNDGPTADEAQRNERTRVKDILAIGKRAGMVEDAEKAVSDGTSLEDFRKKVIEERFDGTPVETNPELGLSRKEAQRFSIRKAILAAADGAGSRSWDDAEFEREVMDETRKLHVERDFKGLAIPLDVMTRRLDMSGTDQVNFERMLAASGLRAGQNVGTATAGGNLVGTDLMSGSFVDILKNVMVLTQLGATWLEGLVGNVAIPRQTGGASYYFVGESGATTASAATFDQLALTPKTVAARNSFSRKLLLQSSISIEQFVQMEIAFRIAEGMQHGCLLGTGADNQPTGLITQGIAVVALGTNGDAPGWPMVVNLETECANDNVLMGNFGYLTNSKVRGKLKQTQKFSSTNGMEVWQKGSRPGEGELNGYPALVTNQVPSNLDKGTSTGVCSAMFYGRWADMIIGLWGVLDMIVDPYTNSDKGDVNVTGFQSFDTELKHDESFAVCKDILTT